MSRGDRLAVIVAGMVCGVPRQGGAAWAVLQYVMGLRRLGHDVMFVEQLGEHHMAGATAYFDMVAGEFGLDRRASLLSSTGTVLTGARRSAVERFAARADLVLNLSGTLRDESLLERAGRRVYVDLDPGFTQLWQESGGIEMGLEMHDRFVTVGLAIGDERCPIPTGGRHWITTVPPVDLSRWPVAPAQAPPQLLRSVGHWRGYGSMTHEGLLYGQRAHSMRRLLSIASRSPVPVEFALGIDRGDRTDIESLRRHGWRLTDPDLVAGTPAEYAAFVRSSWGELGIAKSGYVVSHSGWFSDRSVCYLACGLPVIAQDTGFSAYLPTGEGLLAFQNADQAVAAVEAVRRDYETHRVAARRIAEEHFDSDRVLATLIGAV